MKRSEIIFSVLLVPLDIATLFASFIFAYYLRDEYQPNPSLVGSLAAKFNYLGTGISLPFSQYLHYLAFIVPAMVAIFALAGLYGIRQNTSWLRRFVQIVLGVSVGEFFILLLFLLKNTFFIPRATVFYSWIIATFLVFAVRIIIQLIQRALRTKGIGVIRLAVIGKSAVAEQIIRRLSDKPSSTYRLALHADSIASREVIKQIDRESVDELIVVSAKYNNEDMIILRNHCLEHQISFSFVPPLLTELQSSFEARSVGSLPVIEVQPTPLEGWGRVLKRLFDLIASLFLIMLFSPVYLGIAILMRILDPGPMIYRHRRIGKNRRPIDIYKFRSMRWEYCDGPGGNPEGDRNKARLFAENPELAKEYAATFKLKKDPRISAIGKILRTTSLDELPQFFNVLGGSLSLVGPRPIVVKEIDMYGEKARILFTVKPGVTGLWQVSGRSDVTYEERTALDAQYIEHWNLWSDIAIMAKTGWVLLMSVVGRSKKGAY